MIPLPPFVPCGELAEIPYDCASPQTLCVGDVEGSEYDSLLEADWEARPGDLVIVAPGSYGGVELWSSGDCNTHNGDICTEKRPITWRALGEVTLPPGDLGSGLLVFADYISIEGFTIDGQGADQGSGIELNNTAGVELRCNTLLGSALDGIGVWGGGDVLIERNHIHNNGRNGIGLYGVYHVRVKNNLISANGYHGIRSHWWSSGIKLSFNTIDASLSAIKIVTEGSHRGAVAMYGNLLYGEQAAVDVRLDKDARPDLIVDDPALIWRDRASGDYRLSDDSEARGFLPSELLENPLLEDLAGARPQGEALDAGALSWVCVKRAEDDPCNGIDDNCDGRIDEDPVPADRDGDGVADGETVCDPDHPPEVSAYGDCDDNNPRRRRCALRFSGGCSTAPVEAPPLLVWLVSQALRRRR